MAESFPTLPKELTYTYWDSGKAKLTPSTGIGKEIKKVEAAYKKIKVRDVNLLSSANGPRALQAAVEATKTEWPNIEACRKALFAFSAFAKKKGADGKKSKTFPKKSRILIETMSETASGYATAIRDTPDRMRKEAEKSVADYAKRLAYKRKLSDDTLKKVKSHAAAAAKIDVEITKLNKAALIAAKSGNGDDAKNTVKKAADQLAALEKLEKTSANDIKVWRTDKTKLDKEDNTALMPNANEIINNNKAVITAVKKNQKAVQQVFDAVAKLTRAA